MNAARRTFYRGLFLVTAIYDVVLGITFTFFGGTAYDLLGIRDKMPPGGYVPLLGAFILVIGITYGLIARADLQRNRDLILVGALFKLAFAVVALSFWARGEVPHSAFTGFGVADLVFLVLMLECLVHLRGHPQGIAPRVG